MRASAIAALLLGLGAWPASASPSCPPAGHDLASLQALRAADFGLPDAAARTALANGLLACLGDPDPALRDGIAYEALAHWMRAGDFDADTLRTLRDALYAQLDAADAQGFRRPFAALVLSEVARTDRVAPWMSAPEREAMVARATAFLRGVDDDRGFDEREGWRHGVAHGADWLMQLSLNPALGRGQLDEILDAVASQAVPQRAHAYVFGESARLAQPVLFVAKRGLVSDAQWRTWFAALAARVGAPGRWYRERAGLARRHDLVAFLDALYVGCDRSDDAQVRALKPAVAEAVAKTQ